MSGSPKYCQVRLQADRERLLREERERQAALEKQRRETEAARLALERMQRLRAQVMEDAEALRVQLEARRADSSLIGEWLRVVGQASAGARGAASDLDLRLEYDRLRRVQREFRRSFPTATNYSPPSPSPAEPASNEQAVARASLAVDLDRFRDRLAGLQADSVVTRWAAEEIAQVKQQAAILDVERDVAAGRRALADLEGAFGQAVARAQEAQLKEERRQHIVGGICDALQELGFVIQRGYPTPEYPDYPESATILQAVRPDGVAMAVSVPQEGEVWYDLAGVPRRIETGSEGQAVATCDEAEAEILRMHAILQESFGVETGELMWEGKNHAVRKRTSVDVGHGDSRADSGGERSR